MRTRQTLVVGAVAVSLVGIGVATLTLRKDPVVSPPTVTEREIAPPPRVVPPAPVLLDRLGTPFHTPGGSGLVFSPDGKRFATAGLGDSVRVYDIATRADVFSVRINPTNVWHSQGSGARYCDSGHIVAFWCGYQEQPALLTRIAPDGTHTNYPLSEGTLRKVFEDYSRFEREASAFSISDDGTRLAVNWAGKIEVYDTANGDAIVPKQRPKAWQAATRDAALALSRDGRLLAMDDGAQMRVFTIATGAEVDKWEVPLRVGETPHKQFNRDGTRILLTRRSWELQSPGSAQIRDLANKQTEHLPDGVGGPLCQTAFSPAGETVAIIPIRESRGPVVLWDATTKKVTHRLEGTANASSAVFSPGGDVLAISDRNDVTSLWSVETGKLLPNSADPPVAIRQLRYLENGQSLAAFAGRWITWDLATKQRTDRLSGAGRLTELSRDGRLAAKLDGDQLSVLNAETGKEQWSVRVPATDKFTRLKFSPDGARLVTRTREVVQVWDVVYGRELSSVPVLPGQYLLAVSKDARRVAIGYRDPEHFSLSSDGTEYRTFPAVYDTVTRKKLWAGDLLVSESYPTMFSPDDQFLAYEVQWEHEGGGGPNRVAVLEAATGRVAWQTEPNPRVVAYSMAFSADSELLALGQHKGTISLHQATTGKLLGDFSHNATVNALAFSPDGKTLAVASADASVKLWDVRPLLPRSLP